MEKRQVLLTAAFSCGFLIVGVLAGRFIPVAGNEASYIKEIQTSRLFQKSGMPASHDPGPVHVPPQRIHIGAVNASRTPWDKITEGVAELFGKASESCDEPNQAANETTQNNGQPL